MLFLLNMLKNVIKKMYDKTSKNNITDIYLFLILLKNLQSGIFQVSYLHFQNLKD